MAGTDTGTQGAAAALGGLQEFAGAPAEFWPRYVAAAGMLIRARTVLLVRRSVAEQAHTEDWRVVAAWTAEDVPAAAARQLLDLASSLVAAVQESGCAIVPMPAAAGTTATGVVAAVAVLKTAAEAECLLLAELPSQPEPASGELVSRMLLAAAVPDGYAVRRLLRQAQHDVVQFAAALDLLLLLNAETRFVAACMTLCNELASRHDCHRVSIGWQQGGTVRLAAISNTERFDRRMDAVQRLEALMEECFDQDEEILWPPPEQSTAICRDHEGFAAEQGVTAICSLPLGLEQEVRGVLCCERQSGPAFTEADVDSLRLTADQAVRRLADLKKVDRLPPVRWAASVRRCCRRLLGVEHTGAKLLGFLVAAAAAVLIFGRMDYRVKAPFVVRAEHAAVIPGPFDGFIAEVDQRVGDKVRAGQRLLVLDTKDLLMEEAAALAEEAQHRREAEKARADNALAAMRIALALTERAAAQLARIRHRLRHAEIVAPFAGVIVEGDLRERIGAPVTRGDTLLRVARLDALYAEIEVDEADIHHIVAGAVTGTVAFASQTGDRYEIRVEQVQPMAVAKEKQNVFLVRAEFTPAVPAGCRPGMTGITRLNAGPRRLFWIFTHKTIDFLRLRLWW